MFDDIYQLVVFGRMLEAKPMFHEDDSRYLCYATEALDE